MDLGGQIQKCFFIQRKTEQNAYRKKRDEKPRRFKKTQNEIEQSRQGHSQQTRNQINFQTIGRDLDLVGQKSIRKDRNQEPCQNEPVKTGGIKAFTGKRLAAKDHQGQQNKRNNEKGNFRPKIDGFPFFIPFRSG